MGIRYQIHVNLLIHAEIYTHISIWQISHISIWQISHISILQISQISIWQISHISIWQILQISHIFCRFPISPTFAFCRIPIFAFCISSRFEYIAVPLSIVKLSLKFSRFTTNKLPFCIPYNSFLLASSFVPLLSCCCNCKLISLDATAVTGCC